MSADLGSSGPSASAPAIPRLIHQTWKSSDVPPRYRGWVDSVRSLHPDHGYRLWTDDDNRRLIAESYPWFLSTYDTYKHAVERADAVRYFILYTHGGVYVDLDMEFLKPMDELVRGGEVVFSLEAGPSIHDTVISNAFMAAPPSHPFFREVMTSLADLRRRDVTFGDIFCNTGPDMLAAQCRRLWDRYSFRIVGLDAICPRRVLPQNPAIGFLDIDEIRVRKLLHAIHHNTESWNIQLACPSEAIAGYDLHRDADIPDHDIDFVDCSDGSLAPLVAACDRNPDAIGFNFNGFIKAAGEVEPYRGGGSWLKRGIRPWVCVKRRPAEPRD